MPAAFKRKIVDVRRRIGIRYRAADEHTEITQIESDGK